MKFSLCCCVAILIAVVATASGSGTWDDLRTGAERFLNNFAPKRDLEKATDKVVHLIDDIWDGVLGGGECASDSDCNSVLGHCNKMKPTPSCEPTPLAYWVILMAALGCMVMFVFPVTDDREDHCS